MLLIDGLRTDEAEGLPAFRAFAARGASGELHMSAPTLSSTAYHAFLTGVPAWASGVRTNRFQARPRTAPARADTLFDRARRAGLRATYAAEGLRWLLSFATDAATADANVFAEGRPFQTAALGRLSLAGEPGRATLVHMLAVDESAHAFGIHSEEHSLALARADALISALDHATQNTDTVAIVLSDHGHLDSGGHGGNEAMVQRAPFAISAPGLDALRDVRLDPEEVAPSVAALARLQPPRHALRVSNRGLVALDTATTRSVAERQAVALRAHRALVARAERFAWMGALLALLVSALGLWLLRRGFGAFDAATLVTPPLWLGLCLVAHVHLLGRPLSVSAIDLVTAHVLRLAGLSAVVAALAIVVGARGAVALGAHPLAAARRAASAVGWAALCLFVSTVSLIGASLAPWPESELLAYGPVLFGGLAGGALVATAACLLSGVSVGVGPSHTVRIERHAESGGATVTAVGAAATTASVRWPSDPRWRRSSSS